MQDKDLYKKRFQFFQKEIIIENEDQKSPTSCSQTDIGLNNAVYLEQKLFIYSKSDNKIYVFDKNKITGSFEPFSQQLIAIERAESSNNLLFTVGVDKEGDFQIISLKLFDQAQAVFDYNQENRIIPKAQYQINKSMTTNNPVCLAITNDMQYIAVGFQDGSIFLLNVKNIDKLDGKDKMVSLEKSQIQDLKFTNEIDKQKNEKVYNLFYTTKYQLCCYRGLNKKNILDQTGASKMDVIQNNNQLFVLQDEYEPVQNIIEYSPLKKEETHYFDDIYLVVTSIANNQKTGQTQLNIYDIKNKYIAFSFQFEFINTIVVTEDVIIIQNMNQNGLKQLYQFTEKDNQIKLEAFFNRKFFDVALTFAKNQGMNENLLAEISRLHGDHFYEKGDFKNAIVNYCKTIGFIEPSYIIRKFLDVQQIDNLIQYLENIHEKQLADEHHLTLLLNCYVKQKAITKLEQFVQQCSLNHNLFDNDTAIKVCRDLKKSELALKLAINCKNYDQQIKILIEDEKKFEDVLKIIEVDLDLQNKIKYIEEYGQQLMKNKPQKTSAFIRLFVDMLQKKQDLTKQSQNNSQVDQKNNEIIQFYTTYDSDKQKMVIEVDKEQLIKTNFSKPDKYFHLFVGQDDELENYLLFLKDKDKLPDQQIIYHRLFEYYLTKFTEFKAKTQNKENLRQTYNDELFQHENKIIKLLDNKNDLEKTNINQLLLLFKMYGFNKGIIYLLDHLDQKEELLHYYMEINDHEKVLEICRRNKEKKVDLWIKALKYFCQKNETFEKNNVNINEIVKQLLDDIYKIDAFSPQLVLQIISKNNNISFDVIKSYFYKKLQEDLQQIKYNKKQISEKQEKAKQDRIQIKQLETQAKVIHQQRCFGCDQPLSLPTVHFFCDHSYHENCLVNEKEKDCNKCQYDFNNIQERVEQIEKQGLKNNIFQQKLQNNNKNQFDLFAEFMGKGLFNY